MPLILKAKGRLLLVRQNIALTAAPKDERTVKSSKRILLIVYVLCSSFVICPVVFIYLSFIRPENAVYEALDIYPGAQLVFEDQARYGSDTGQKSLYYWSADALEGVQSYYENTSLAFVKENSASQWLMSGFNLDGSEPVASSGTSLDHGSFCDFEQPYQCVSLALIDASSSDLYRLAPISPSQFLYLTPPPSLLSITQQGTLIVFSYYKHVE